MVNCFFSKRKKKVTQGKINITCWSLDYYKYCRTGQGWGNNKPGVQNVKSWHP